MSLRIPRSRNQVKLSINKTKVVERFEVCETKTLNFRKTYTRSSYRIVTSLYQINFSFTLERYIPGRFLYRTGVRTLCYDIILMRTLNRETLIVTHLNSLKY